MLADRNRGGGGLFLVTSLLTLVMAAPVLRAPASRLFGSEIVGRHEAPFFVINSFEHPRPPGLYTQPVTDYFGAAVAAISGNGVVAYNSVVLASFPLAALFAYMLAIRLTGSRVVSWLTGLLYAFAPFHIAQSAYHPHGAQTQWLPLYLLALWLCVERAGIRRLLLLTLSLTLVALSNFYYGLIATVLTPFALLGFWAVQRGREGTPPQGLKRTLLALGALAGAGLAYVAAIAPAVFDKREQLAFPRSDLALYGAQWSSYLTPPIEHPLLGSWVRGLWELRGPGGLLEQQITVGFGLLLLAAAALILYFRGERAGGLAATPALVLIAATSFAFSLAPAEAAGPESILRPSGLIFEFLPMFRAYARFGLAVFLAIAILASVGAGRLLRAGSKPQRVLGFGLLLLVLVELAPFPPFRWRDVLPTSAHRFLSDQENPVRVLDCVPRTQIAEQIALRHFAHEISLRDESTDCGDPDIAAKLTHEGFTHLLVRRGSPLGDWLAKRTERPASAGSRPVGHFEDALLYELKAAPQQNLYLEFNRGFYWREFLGDESYRWMKGSGALTIVNPSTGNVPLQLELKLHAFPEPRGLLVELDDSAVSEFEVTTEPDLYRLPEMSIAPGRHSLRLLPDSPAVVADDLLANGDLRELSVALWGWTTFGPR